MRSGFQRSSTRWILVLVGSALAGCARPTSQVADGSSGERSGQATQLLNVSNDPTRELWKGINEAFIADYQKKTATKVSIKQSHAGSSSQARAVIDGLGADVVTLAMETDIDAISKAGLIDESWRDRLPNRSIPYFSTIVFVVRKGNPKGIKEWADLGKAGIEVITPNPKTSGNGKLSFLAAWGSVVLQNGTEEEALKLVTTIYQQTPVLDTAARAATTTFTQKRMGDVHLTWESEAHLELAETGDSLEIVYPSISIKAEPPVAWVDRNVAKKGSLDLAKAYLEFAYTPEAQRIFAQHFYRPINETVAQESADQFPNIRLFGITEIAESWEAAHQRFFAEGQVFDRIYTGDAGPPMIIDARK